ncbi:SDR family NAD(P)-dependent oxidoreductase [Blastococcus atacamensis]|uniref:SDR family NAD(P)-dependent oxidoreductase n=1 Tax=Blastococcus atacamensis TaxID=2070508 RepID=UPI000CEBE0FA|nr:SDR family oxidoreductase [Blastococcus atacamensis]
MGAQLALVTGGASGIGLATARLLKQHGDVLIADRDPSLIDVAEREGFGAVAADVTSTADWRCMAQHVRDRYGRLDVLVHNAGTAHIAPLVETSDADLRRVLETNVLSVLIGTREMWDLLVAARGCVVNVASVSALVGQDAAAAYVASKGAVVAVTRALAVELAPHGVRVNSVCPGSTDTPLLARHFASLPDGKQARQRLIERHPIGRLLTAEDIAPSVAHLAGPGAMAITGANVVVDGGLTATFDFGSSFAGGGPKDAA